MSNIQLNLREKRHMDLLAKIHKERRNELQRIKDPSDLCKDHETKGEKAERGTDHLLILAEYAELLESRQDHLIMGGNSRSSEDTQYIEDNESRALLQAHVKSEEVLQGRIRLSKIRRLARLKDVSAVVERHQDKDLSGESEGVYGQKEAIKVSGQQKEEKIKSLCAVASQQQAEFCKGQFPCFGQPVLEEILCTPDLLLKEQQQIYPVMLQSSNEWTPGYCNQLYYPFNQVFVPDEESNVQICTIESSCPEPLDGSRVIARQRRLLRSLERRKQMQKRHFMANDSMPMPMPEPHPQLVLHVPTYGHSAQGSVLPVNMGRELPQIASREGRTSQIPKKRVSKCEYQLLDGTRHVENSKVGVHGEPEKLIASREYSGGLNHESLVEANIRTEKISSQSKKIRITHIRREARLKLVQKEANQR